MVNNINLGAWLDKMYQDYTSGREQKDVMFGKGVTALQHYADIFRPGGAYGAGVEAMLERGSKKAVAGGMQNLVSSGLVNTTMPMHLSQTYEEEIGTPTRLKAEDTRMERLGGALGTLAQIYAGYDTGAPTAGDIAHMATGGFGTMMSGRIADLQAQQAMQERRATNQANLPSQQMFGGGAGSGGGSGGGGGGGGGSVSSGMFQHTSGGFSNPYAVGSGGYGSGEGAGGYEEPWVMVGGERVIPGTNIPWSEDAAAMLARAKGRLSRGESAIGMTPQQTYDIALQKLKSRYAG